jgi:hypothetical protein
LVDHAIAVAARHLERLALRGRPGAAAMRLGSAALCSRTTSRRRCAIADVQALTASRGTLARADSGPRRVVTTPAATCPSIQGMAQSGAMR